MAVLASNYVRRPYIVTGDQTTVWETLTGSPAPVGGTYERREFYGLPVAKGAAGPVQTALDGFTGTSAVVWLTGSGDEYGDPLHVSIVTGPEATAETETPLVIPQQSTAPESWPTHSVTVPVPAHAPGDPLWLRLSPSSAYDLHDVTAVRVDSSEDERGIFDGNTPDPGDGTVFEWTGTPLDSASVLTGDDPDPDPDPDPEPEPDPEPLELSGRVMALLGIDAADTDAATVVRESVALMAMMVEAYTRGNGFKTVNGARIIAEPLQAVIVTGAARYAANPSGLSYRAGSEQVMDSFKGWTLAEQYVLNNYRKRWH